ncbi:MAG: amidohydrolase family protein [Alphaproteobacteria bacterium]|nr:amidohydrolase family protein [Alphaproteobacteria bacterium]
MAFDLIVRNARIAGAAGDAPLNDIGVQDGRIAAIEAGLTADGEELDAGGCLVSPGLIETHIHLDKSRILDRSSPSPNRGMDHMKRVAAAKPSFTVEDVYARARASLETSLINGVMHMRTHVEVDPNVGMKSFEALEQLAKDYSWAIDLDLCVFIQEGWSGVPEADTNLVAGLDRGAKVIGGAPSYDSDGPAQINRIFELAKEYDADVDIHLDIGPSFEHLDIYQVCKLTDENGWGGRVAIGHGSKYAAMPPAELAELGKLLADTGVTVTVLPATDLFTQGRQMDHSVIRGVADANALVEHGVNCCLSTNNILNPFTPFGDGSLVRIANMYANVAQRGTAEEQAEIFEMVSHRPGRLLRREDYGIAVGNPADLVVWDAPSTGDVIATNAQPLFGFKAGRRTFTRARAELHRL